MWRWWTSQEGPCWFFVHPSGGHYDSVGLIITPCIDECREHACLVICCPGDWYWVIAFHSSRNHRLPATGTIWFSIPPPLASESLLGTRWDIRAVDIIKMPMAFHLLYSNHRFYVTKYPWNTELTIFTNVEIRILYCHAVWNSLQYWRVI